MRTVARNKILAALLLLGIAPSVKAVSLADVPLFIGANIPPQVMLDISKDQQLYKKAYNDYSDLDGDGALETTYKHGIDYYGYFDSRKCYTYSTGNNRFEPINPQRAATATDKYCSDVAVQSTTWSGNFLNWISMTRMDAVRKLLYGGLRSTDQTFASGGANAVTVLERVYVPQDAHSWAKYYSGTDINRLTPFNPATTDPGAAGTNSVTFGGTFTVPVDKTFNTTLAGISVGDQIQALCTTGTENNKKMMGWAKTIVAGTSVTVNVDFSDGVSGNSCGIWMITNLSRTGISFCNLTVGSTATAPNVMSNTNTNPPLIRAAQGNYALWSANERHQCYWSAETSSPAKGLAPSGARFNGNRAAQSGLNASLAEPIQATHGLGTGSAVGEYIARVQACVPAVLGTEKCKQYPNGNYKPIGLLQVYGDPGLLHFGLMTGSYVKNISGGVLRKNVGVFTNEVNLNTDGTFVSPLPTDSIVNTLNRMRIYGYSYNGGLYNNAMPTGDSCGFQLTSITEGNCTSWGNPMSEIFFESLRYFAGAPAGAGTSPTAAYNTSDTGRITGLTTATWVDPLNSTNYCAPLNVLVFNASVSTNDDDLANTVMTDIGSSSTAATLTNTVGAAATGENITGSSFFVGKIVSPGTPTLSTDPGFELCTSKSVSGLGHLSGICPEGPTLSGSYLMAGLAHYARTNKIRSDLTVPATDLKSLKVTTYGIQLATNVPQIRVAVTGESTPRAIIQPAYRLFNVPPQGGGTLVDIKIVSATQTATSASGSVYVNWEDSEQGGDYDQDMWGILSYCMQIGGDTTSCPGQGANTIKITTNAIAESTGNGQGFGYIISGTTQDGPHFHSGIEGFNYTDPTGVLGCTNCQVVTFGSGQSGPQSVTYTLGAGTGGTLQDPLWYAAKWGGFNDQNANNRPDLVAEWDVKINATGAAGSDGIPDNYFLVTNPLGLETALDKAFIAILVTSSASSVATNSASLQTGSTIYQARFNSNEWSGQLLAIPISTTGVLSTTATWDAGQVINGQNFNTGRKIITYKPSTGTGIPFRWPVTPASPTATELDASQITALKAGGTDTDGMKRLNYVRGDPSNEGGSSTLFRQRPTSKLGDIVNSNPFFVGAPSAGFFDPTYTTFRNNNINRKPVLYVGGNDGMLHGFDACPLPLPTPAATGCPATAVPGSEVLAFIPSKSYTNISQLTSQTYTASNNHKFFVDGPPTVDDVCLLTPGTSLSPATANCPAVTNWKTVIVGGLGRGGQGYFALDVTNPSASNFVESNAASLVLWEFTDANDADLGYSYSEPLIKKMANGKWAVIFGNGYNNSVAETGETACTAPGVPAGCTTSTTGHAALYILFIQEGLDGWTAGSDYIKISTGVGSTAVPNGLNTPTTLDSDGDNVVDFIYAGDLQGNMWKFNVGNANPALWAIAFAADAPAGYPNGKPLYTAKDAVTPTPNRQPITSVPNLSFHPNGGFMVLFGTGQYLGTGDTTTTSQQTYYGIWDKNDGTTVASTNRTPASDVLMRQQLLGYVTVGLETFPVTTAHQPNYASSARTDPVVDGTAPTTSPPTPAVNPAATAPSSPVPANQRGWYLDWPNLDAVTQPAYGSGTATGERVVFPGIFQSGIITFVSLSPSSAPCAAGGSSITYDLSSLTGSRPVQSTLDITGNGLINSGDLVTFGGVQVAVSGKKSKIGITPTPTRIQGGTGSGGVSYDVASGSAGYGGPGTGVDKGLEVTKKKIPGAFGRITWREIISN